MDKSLKEAGEMITQEKGEKQMELLNKAFQKWEESEVMKSVKEAKK